MSASAPTVTRQQMLRRATTETEIREAITDPATATEDPTTKAIRDWAERPDAKRIHRDSGRAVLANIKGIAAGEIVVVSGLGTASA